MAQSKSETTTAQALGHLVLMLATDIVVGDAHHRDAIRVGALDLADAMGDDGLAAKERLTGTLTDEERNRLAALSAPAVQPAVTTPPAKAAYSG